MKKLCLSLLLCATAAVSFLHAGKIALENPHAAAIARDNILGGLAAYKSRQDSRGTIQKIVDPQNRQSSWYVTPQTDVYKPSNYPGFLLKLSLGANGKLRQEEGYWQVSYDKARKLLNFAKYEEKN